MIEFKNRNEKTSRPLQDCILYRFINSQSYRSHPYCTQVKFMRKVVYTHCILYRLICIAFLLQAPILPTKVIFMRTVFNTHCILYRFISVLHSYCRLPSCTQKWTLWGKCFTPTVSCIALSVLHFRCRLPSCTRKWTLWEQWFTRTDATSSVESSQTKSKIHRRKPTNGHTDNQMQSLPITRSYEHFMKRRTMKLHKTTKKRTKALAAFIGA